MRKRLTGLKKKQHIISKIKYESYGAILFEFTEAEGELLSCLYINVIINYLKKTECI